MLKLYLAGPMSGLPESNYPAFHAAAKQLREAGYEVVNPAETELPLNTPWRDFMREGITQMLTCDAVALLPGHHQSVGTIIERGLANRLDMQTFEINIWLRGRLPASRLTENRKKN